MTAEDSSVRKALAVVWRDDGPMDRFRDGVFRQEDADEVLEALKALPDYGTARLSQDEVRLLWYMPTFLGFQDERIVERSGVTIPYAHFRTQALNEVVRVLGMP
ncbi:MAG: hypothetical protein Q8J89_04475 [Caulobacter sp.]|nr:hypothetical protein [Caulobacter sp.]